MKSAGRVLFALIPPTRAAAMNTTSGRSVAKKLVTCAWFVRSSSSRPRTSRCRHPSASSRRMIAEPTMPRWPATKTRAFSSPGSSLLMVIEDGIAFACDEGIPLCKSQVGLHHLGDKSLDGCACRPPEFLPCLGRITEKRVNLRGPVVAWINPHDHVTGLRAGYALLVAATRPISWAPLPSQPMVMPRPAAASSTKRRTDICLPVAMT